MSYCVAIVGRANVGKSSLFNTLYGRRVAIVHPTPGVTRDRLTREIPAEGGYAMELVDTGGVGMESNEELAADVDRQIQTAITQADLVLFVVDAALGLHPDDRLIARRLRAGGKNVLLVANKADHAGSGQNTHEFHELGMGEPLRVSAVHNTGLKDLKSRLREHLVRMEPDPSRQQPPIKLAVAGQRNAGKSTLINCMARQPRVVVSEVPGTTRDSIDVLFEVERDGRTERFIAIDTAGVRKTRQLKDSVDYYSQVRTHQSVVRADVVVLLIDAHRPISKVDKQWGKIITDLCKPTIVAVNKMDMAPDAVEDMFVEYLRDHLPGLRFAPQVFISAKTGSNVFSMLEIASELYRQSHTRTPTGELNTVLHEITSRRPPPSRTSKRGKILFATQVATGPPSIALFVNDSADITEPYRRYILTELRERLPYAEVPIKLMVRRRRARKRTPGGRNH